MRFGLHKPGAVPFLVLLVFSLLTLVPSLSSIYNLKLADCSYYGSAARQVRLLKDGVAHISPDTYPTSEQRKSIIMTTPRRPQLSRLSRSSRAETDAPLPTSSDTTPIDSRGQLPQAASEPFMFTRRARAFKAYVCQQLDDYHFLGSCANRSSSTARNVNSALPSSFSPLNSSMHPSSPSDKRRQLFYNFRGYKPQSDSDTEDGVENSILQLLPLTPLRETWRHVCHVATQWESMMKEHYQTYSNGSLRQTGNHETSMKLSNSSTIAHDEFQDAAAGRSAERLRGSCMAVVVGLTVGIMWF